MKSRGKEPDERLLVEAAQKDSGRFAELYEIHFGRVYAYIAQRVRGRSEAQDLTSHVFHQALANLGRFEWRGAPFAAWLFRIAANAIADHAQRAAREHSTAAGDPSGDAAANLAATGKPGKSAEAGVEEAERRAQLFRLVDRLPEDQRRVIQMRFAEEKSIREIARGLGRTAGAVKQLQFRALETLRARMRDDNG